MRCKCEQLQGLCMDNCVAVRYGLLANVHAKCQRHDAFA